MAPAGRRRSTCSRLSRRWPGPVLVVLAAELSWLVAQPAAARRSLQPASSGRASPPWSARPGRLPWRRSPVRVHHVVSTQRFRHPGPAVQPSSVRPSGVQPVRCPARLVSSPSGVQPVRCPARPVSGRLVSPRPASSRLLSAPVRPDVSISSHLRRWRWGPGWVRPGDRHHRNGSSPGGLPRLGAARWTAEQARTRATLPGSRVGQWGSVADPGRVGGRQPRLPAEDQAGQAGVRSAHRWRLRCGHGSRRQREVAAPAAWRPSQAGCATTVRGRREPAAPGGRARRGRSACRRDGRAAPARPRLVAGAPGSLPTAL